MWVMRERKTNRQRKRLEGGQERRVYMWETEKLNSWSEVKSVCVRRKGNEVGSGGKRRKCVRRERERERVREGGEWIVKA